jgi:glycosyltransferase involved in cell wall biosynthesis
MSASPEISIVIPAYQHARELPRCLASVFAQTFEDFEVILVNDGSTDGTEQAIAPFRNKLTYIAQENRGGNAARNRGFAEARGRFVLFCDADVIMRPDMLERMQAALHDNPAASYAYSSFNFGWKRFRLWPFDADRLRRMNYIHTTSLIRREHFPGFDESVRRLQDWDLWLTMLASGRTGVWIPETLFTCLPHKGGISTWVPGIVYEIPWRKFGIRIDTVEKFVEARERMRAKHRLPDAEFSPAGASAFGTWYARAFLYYVIFELISLYGFLIPQVSTVAFFAIILATAWLAWKRPEQALLVLLAELFVGSQGGYMVAYAGDGLFVSLRLGLFLIVFGSWLSRSALGLLRAWRDGAGSLAIRLKNATTRQELAWFGALRDGKLLWPYAGLLAVIAYGVARGVALGNDFGEVFFDANGYAFFALLPAFLAAFAGEHGAVLRMRTAAVLLAAVTDAVLKALIVLFFYSHRQFFVAWNLYVWVRDTRVGEITIMVADYYRIFFQSQIWALAVLLAGALYAAYAPTWKERRVRLVLGVVTLAMTAMVLSLSRSFWFGAVVAALIGAAILAYGRAAFAVWRRLVVIAICSVLASVALILAVYSSPWPSKTGDLAFASLLGSRAISFGDAAASSRWALLPKLMEAGREHPVLGSGLGRTVTYETKDPRLLKDNPTGQYTTSAFEWGYHDIWVKFGLIGVAAFAWFLLRILSPLWGIVRTGRAGLAAVGNEPAEKLRTVLAAGGLLAAIALIATNVFSPYLNHPLGIGMLMLVAAWAARPAAAGARSSY